MVSRRTFIKAGAFAGAATMLPWPQLRRAYGSPAAFGLSDPAIQPKFASPVPEALSPSFRYKGNKGKYSVDVGASVQSTGLVGPDGMTPVSTPVFGYGQSGIYTWPGKTFVVRSGEPVEVKWRNKLVDPATGAYLPHLLPVDTSLHWAYSLEGYTPYGIAETGVPMVTHLHGGHSDFQYDGNPEFFFSPGYGVRGPQWLEKSYIYQNDQPAGNLWYHDHALGITRLNVYAGMAGFYFVRDDDDTGMPGNPRDLPAWPYEKAYAIQDRMFYETGELFYPAFPGDPFYEDFITDEDAELPEELFPGGGPTALAEFFGDHMLVNGVIWPREVVEPRQYRLHLLNGTDSRFMALRFRLAAEPDATEIGEYDELLPFDVIGSDQGFASSASNVTMLVSEPGSRYDVVFDFSQVPFGSRIILENIGGDEPFGGDIPGPRVFSETDRVMAFDVAQPVNPSVPDTHSFDAAGFFTGYQGVTNGIDRYRKVALFEGKDEFGRLQPLLGTAEAATDWTGAPIQWPSTDEYINAGLEGPMQGSIAWHSPTTENPALDSTEEWEIYNVTGDAHPVHLHLVHFEIVGRQEIVWDSHTTEEERTIPNSLYDAPANDGTYLVVQPVVQHNGTLGQGFRIVSPTPGADVALGPDDGYVENAPKDMVTALPGQVTRIRTTFDKPGRYVWHCHILSHEDHEMMRVLHVGPGA